MVCSPWVTSADAVAPCNVYDIDTALLDETMLFASEVLFDLTHRRYAGVCVDVVRPVASWRADEGARWWPDGTFSGRSRWGWCSCNRSKAFGCSTVPEVRLPGSPVRVGTVEVVVDGVSLVEDTDYRVDDGNRLVRIDGEGWPCCQDLSLATTEDGTWEVSYHYGVDPPQGGLTAAAVLGCQLYLAVPGASGVKDRQSELPKRVTSIVRQGVTLAVIDPLKMFDEGKTGIPIVDLWIASANRGANMRPATVHRPGRGRSVRRTP